MSEASVAVPNPTIAVLSTLLHEQRAARPTDGEYQLLFEANPLPMWVLDHQTLGFLAVNEAAVRHYGFSRDEFLALSVLDIGPPEEARRLLDAISAIRANQPFGGEWIHRTRDGAIIDVELTTQPIVWGSREARLVAVFDVTERKRIQERLRMAMAETHHRVKNNLQVISALVDMQVMQDGDTVPVAELKRLSQHIRSLAALHEVLTREAKQNGDIEAMSAKTALQDLLPLTRSVVGERELRLTADDFLLPIRQVTSLIVLATELISNAAKHGEGDIELSLLLHGETAELEVRDHGRGLPEGFQPGRAGHTGMELIQSLTAWDLKGQIAWENASGGGARAVVTFPVREWMAACCGRTEMLGVGR